MIRRSCKFKVCVCVCALVCVDLVISLDVSSILIDARDCAYLRVYFSPWRQNRACYINITSSSVASSSRKNAASKKSVRYLLNLNTQTINTGA